MKKLQFLLAGAILAAPLALQARYERTIERTFSVQPGGTLNVTTQGGDIRVVPGSGNDVRVVAVQRFPRADNEAEADDIMRDVTLEIEQEGNNVTVLTRTDRRMNNFWRNRVQIDFTITVPARYNSNLRTSGGDIDIGNLTGSVDAHTSGGDVDVARIDGPINVSTSGGDISVQEGTSTARLRTSGGDITVGRIAGSAELGTSGGDIEVRSAGGTLNATTSGGDVVANFEGGIPADTTLSTSGGDVTARVSRSVPFRLDASTSGGEVEAAGLTITIERGAIGKNRLVGAVNGGGPVLKLRTSGGDIDLITR